MAKFIFSWVLLILVYFFFTNSLLHQLQQPVLKYPGADNSFWAIMASGIYSFFIQQKWAAIFFDVLIVFSCGLTIIFPNKKIFAIVTALGLWLLYVFFCGTAGKQYAQIGYLIPPVAFVVLNPKKFDLSWNVVRYWVCFLYVCAGLSKLYYGGFGFDQNMSNIVMQDNAQSFVFIKEGWRYNLYHYFIEHNSIAQWLYRAAAVIEFACIIGFFTKKYDVWLLVSLIFFHVGNYFLLNISFVEQSLIFAPFLPWHKLVKTVK
jgi:hypothetical protein